MPRVRVYAEELLNVEYEVDTGEECLDVFWDKLEGLSNDERESAVVDRSSFRNVYSSERFEILDVRPVPAEDLVRAPTAEDPFAEQVVDDPGAEVEAESAHYEAYRLIEQLRELYRSGRVPARKPELRDDAGIDEFLDELADSLWLDLTVAERKAELMKRTGQPAEGEE